MVELEKYQRELIETKQIRDLLEQHLLVVITDPRGIMTHVSDSLCEISQYSREELVGKRASFIGSGYHAPSFFQEMWDTIKRGQYWYGRIRNQARDGSYFWVSMTVASLLDKAGKPVKFVGVRQNITRMKKAEAQLQFQAHILANVNDAVISTDAHGHINYWNQGAEQLYQMSASAVLGKSLSDVYTPIWITDEDKQDARVAISLQGYHRAELIHRLSNGREFFVETNTQRIKNEEGELQGLIVVARDITERKQAEKNLQTTLYELEQRNSEMDNYVYKVSHDLRAPLTSMLGLINLTRQETDEQNKEEYLKLIEGRVLRLDQVIQSILQHGKLLNKEIEYLPINWKELIHNCTADLQHYANRDKVRVSVEADENVPFYSDAFRVTLIVRNFLSNAFKYADLRKENNHLHFVIETAEERSVIKVEDNGIGIDPTVLPDVFNMFFRAETTVEGSGLGLYIVKQAVDRLGGTVAVASQKGEGTTFTIELPNQYIASEEQAEV